MQIWRLLKYQDAPPALKDFQDFIFTPMSVSDAVETSIIPKLYSFPCILMMSVIFLQFTETSSNLAAAQAAETN